MQRLGHPACLRCCLHRLTSAKSLHTSSSRAAQTAEDAANAFDIVSTAEQDLAFHKPSSNSSPKSINTDAATAGQPGISGDRPQRSSKARLSPELLRQRKIALGQRVPYRKDTQPGFDKAAVSRPNGTPQRRLERPKFQRVEFEGSSAALASAERPGQTSSSAPPPQRKPRDSLQREAHEVTTLIRSIEHREQRGKISMLPPRRETPGTFQPRRNTVARASAGAGQSGSPHRSEPDRALRSNSGVPRGDRGPRLGGPGNRQHRRPSPSRSTQGTQGRKRNAEIAGNKRMTLEAPPNDAMGLIDYKSLRAHTAIKAAGLPEYATHAGDWRAMLKAAQEARAASNKNSPSRMLDSAVRGRLLDRAEMAAAYNANMPIASKIRLAETLERVVPS